ncbi:MAG: site-specific integrase [Nannocystaceae bacterium]
MLAGPGHPRLPEDPPLPRPQAVPPPGRPHPRAPAPGRPRRRAPRRPGPVHGGDPHRPPRRPAGDRRAARPRAPDLRRLRRALPRPPGPLPLRLPQQGPQPPAPPPPRPRRPPARRDRPPPDRRAPVALRTPGGEPASSRRSLTRPEPPVTRRRKGGPRSPKTINNVLATLRAVLRLAGDYELIDKVPRIPFEPDTRKDPGFLDFEEAEAFMAAAPEGWRLLLRTAIRTGLRRGELLELRWGDLDLEAVTPFVRVSRAIRQERGGAWTIKEPKGRRARSVPLTGSLAAELRARRIEVRGDPDKLVFPAEGTEEEHPEGDLHWRFDQFYAAVRQTARDAGLRKHVHPHLLRHTFASHCYMQRVPPQVVQKWLGHASVTTTERYAHLRPNTDDELIDLLESHERYPLAQAPTVSGLALA